jgi:hypothetical protein
MLMGQSHRLGFAGAQARDFNNYCSTFGVRSIGSARGQQKPRIGGKKRNFHFPALGCNRNSPLGLSVCCYE